MFARRLVSGIMTLMAVQFAGLGGQPVCAGDHHSAASADAAAGMTHDGPMDRGPTDPCAPTSPEPGAPHTPMACLAMTGCAPTGLAAVIVPAVLAPPTTLGASAAEIPVLRSIISTPETPPPIA